MDNPWISGNPLEDFNHTNLDDFWRGYSHISKFAGFRISIPGSVVFYFILGGTVDHRGSVWGQLGQPQIIFEVLCLHVALQEVQKS